MLNMTSLPTKMTLHTGTAILPLCLVLLLIISCTRTYFRRGLRVIPGPFFARFSGLYRLRLVAGGDGPAAYRKVHESYGKIVRVGPNHVSVSDPAMIPVIYGFGNQFKKTPFYTLMSPFYRGTIMDSLFTTRDPVYHRNLRAPVAQLFSMTNMRNYEIYADECTSIFMNAMSEVGGTGVDLAIWLQWYAFDVIGSITFQRRFGFMEERRDVNRMVEGLDAGLNYVGIVGQYPGLHEWLKMPLSILQKFSDVVPDTLTKFMEITEDEVRRYDANIESLNRKDFLAQLRDKESKTGKISDRDMMNHLSNNLLAGSDTTAISLRACFYYILKDPRVHRKLVDEIDLAHKTGLLSEFITYEESLKLPYLQAIMKEAMRMHPGVGFPLERYVPDEGAMICDIDLPGGTIVSMSAPVLHLDKTVYGPDANEFRPERWIDSSQEELKMMERSFLAFGHGSRTCIGKNISLLEMGKFIPQILRHFDVALIDQHADWKTHAAWFWKQSGIICSFERRNV